MQYLKKCIKYYLFDSYHRPLAKLHHLIAYINSFRYLKSSRNFSERIFLLKIPPLSTSYYNLFGRFIFLITNFLSIILLRKFIEKDLRLENNYKDDEYNLDTRPWPPQSMLDIELKNSKNLDNDFIEGIEESYKKSSLELFENKFFSDSNWWKECRQEFNEIFIIDDKVNESNLENFRNDVKTKAEILSDQNFVNKKNSNFTNMIRSLSLVNLYHKLSEKIDHNILRLCSESIVGNNYCPIYRGQRLGYRILRYAYYLSQIKNFTNLKSDENNLILDIGGGYGGLSRVLKHYYTQSTFVIIELPELCLLGSYYLKKCFPNSKIGIYQNFTSLNTISYQDLAKYDFVILTPPFMKKFNSEIFDLSINTTSLGEMTENMQEYYTSNLEKSTKKYFYSVNRPNKRIEKYNSNGFYDLKFKNRWMSKIYKYTHTYHIEFLGKKIK